MLSRLCKILVVFASAAFAALSLAQEAPPAKEMVMGRKIFFAFRPDVKEELKIDDAQWKKLMAPFEGSVQTEGDRIMITLDGSIDLNDAEKQALKVLSAEQSKRLQELWIQFNGEVTAADESIGKVLKLDDGQKKKLAQIVEETAQSLQSIFEAGHDDNGIKQVQAIRKKASEKVAALFTEEQKKGFEALKGKAFKFKSR